MLEKDLEKKFKEKIKYLGGRAYKFISPGNAGVPDRLVVLPGNHIAFVELKRPGEKPRPLQKAQMRFLLKMGATVRTIDSEEKIDWFLKEMIRHEYRGDENSRLSFWNAYKS